MKKAPGFILVLIIGGLLGFFGVFVSVFSDGSTSERLITVAIILIIYGIIGFVCGRVSNDSSYWKWGLILSLPAELILLLYSIKETDILPFSLVYILLILVFSIISAYLGKVFKTKRNSK
ncbi:MAG TPA: hypothetical protein VNT57_00615 [Desulfobacteria bacterium]|nr:hypothetical protein [Desulfobacteria bacterium]